MKRKYPTSFRYNQMETSTALMGYRYIDQGICVGCSTASACQSLISVNGYNGVGEYAVGIYERAKKGTANEDKTGLMVGRGAKEAVRTFNEELEDHKLSTIKLVNDAASIREHLLNKGTVVAGFRWTEGMAYPAPLIPPNTPWYRRLWYHLRAPRFATNSGNKIGLHAIAVMGIDDGKKAFILQNSYGLGYGNKGLVYVTFKDFNDVCKVAYGFECTSIE